MNLIIVTCPQLAPKRLCRLIAQLTCAIESGLVTSLHIICMGDLEAQELVETRYKPERWNDDISMGWEAFKSNIIAMSCKSGVSAERGEGLLSPCTYFPSRHLTQSEHSITFRHILAIKHIINTKTASVVLEDDAVIADEKMFLELLYSLNRYTKRRVFFDLCDDYIPHYTDSCNSLLIGNLRYWIKPNAITRTLMAYAMFPETANLILDSLKNYSLPIDMQMQVALSEQGIPGLSIVNSPFQHGSKRNVMPSAVRQY